MATQPANQGPRELVIPDVHFGELTHPQDALDFFEGLWTKNTPRKPDTLEPPAFGAMGGRDPRELGIGSFAMIRFMREFPINRHEHETETHTILTPPEGVGSWEPWLQVTRILKHRDPYDDDVDRLKIKLSPRGEIYLPIYEQAEGEADPYSQGDQERQRQLLYLIMHDTVAFLHEVPRIDSLAM